MSKLEDGSSRCCWKKSINTRPMPVHDSLPEATRICPINAGRDKKATAKIIGITPAAISLIGNIDLIPSYSVFPRTRFA